jgi:hypothetical protein
LSFRAGRSTRRGPTALDAPRTSFALAEQPVALCTPPGRLIHNWMAPGPLHATPAQSSDIPACRNSGSVSRSSARITGPIRCRVTSQRRVPGSHMPPARCRMWANSRGQRTATMRPNLANSTGPMRAGRGGGERTGDSGHERLAGTNARASPREQARRRGCTP